MSVLANNTKWDKVSSPAFQRHIDDPRWFGERFTEFLQNGCHLGIPTVLDLTDAPFDLEAFGLGGTTPLTDERAGALTKVDLTKVRFRLHKDNIYNPYGNDRLIKHYAMDPKKEYIQLPACLFQMLWERKYLIPKAWRRILASGDKIAALRFTGTEFHRYLAYGDRDGLEMFWDGADWKYNVDTRDSDVVLGELLLEVDKEPAPAEV